MNVNSIPGGRAAFHMHLVHCRRDVDVREQGGMIDKGLRDQHLCLGGCRNVSEHVDFLFVFYFTPEKRYMRGRLRNFASV